jgi:hypothetical protein
MGSDSAEEPAVLFFPANPRVSLLVFLLVSAAISDEKIASNSIAYGNRRLSAGAPD